MKLKINGKTQTITQAIKQTETPGRIDIAYYLLCLRWAEGDVFLARELYVEYLIKAGQYLREFH